MSWEDRVRFGDGFAYAPNEVLIVGASEQSVGEMHREFGLSVARQASGGRVPINHLTGPDEDPSRVIRALRLRGFQAQPNHVLFADSCACCCGPHPAAVTGGQGNPVWANPVWANPVWANPVWANPVWANPSRDSMGDRKTFITTGMRRSTAKPAPAPTDWAAKPLGNFSSVKVVVLDTGYSNAGFHPDFVPSGLDPTSDEDVPDQVIAGQQSDKLLDPVAGHGTFIAGLIDRIAPGCDIIVRDVVEPEGDVTEADLIDALKKVGESPPDLLNLSLSGYAFEQMQGLAAAIDDIQSAGTVVVASAGNDGVCIPTYPASLPGVVSVGAVGPDGPAPFSNYGPWVRACAPGVDVVSTFFSNFDGAETATATGASDPDKFDGWASWSGTSFAAPIVVGAVARAMANYGLPDPNDAVSRVIDDPSLMRILNLGTVVNVK